MAFALMILGTGIEFPSDFPTCLLSVYLSVPVLMANDTVTARNFSE